MNRKFRMKLVFVCISLILVLVIVYSGLRILESTIFYNRNTDFEIKTKTITRDGEILSPAGYQRDIGYGHQSEGSCNSQRKDQ